MKKLAALLALLVLLGGCGVDEVDIINTEPPQASIPAATPPAEPPSPAPSETPAATPEPLAEDMVNIVDIIPGIYIDPRYATANNFTGEAIYASDAVYLRYGTALKLTRVQESLNSQGLSLCIWDGWRSVPAQFKLWRVCPDPAYVANPFYGTSGHCRGNTVDITLVTAEGEPLEMPTDFDNFTALADRDYSDVSDEAARNARLLEREMEAQGFSGYFAEWWHYTDSEAYEVLETLDAQEKVTLAGGTPLLSAPDAAAPAAWLAGGEASVLERLEGGWMLVRCEGKYGYVQGR